jgi:ABC-type multidrug transport system ATPase subunit
MLKVDQISSGYGKKQVLYDVSLEIEKGEIVLLTGGNGSGKSTLLKCIYNLLPLWKGNIFFEGERIDQLKSSDLIQKGIVYIPQKDFCFDNLTVDDNLQIAGNIYSKKELTNRLNNVYEQLGLDKLKNRKPFNLSGGEKKMLAFSMGLIHKPKIILFDEPFSGLDIKGKTFLNNLINNLFCELKLTCLIIDHVSNTEQSYSREISMQIGYLK